MRIEHVALWTDDLERLRAFYERRLGGRAGARYENAETGFSSYFLSFDGGARLELMQAREPSGSEPRSHSKAVRPGWAHVALALGSEARVDELTAELAAAGVPVLDGPRRTGDGYYESTIVDPDGNRIELTA